MNTQANISIDQFVQREVVYCVSSLVSTLVSASAETGSVGDISQDELFDLCGKDDYETPVIEYVNKQDREELESIAEDFLMGDELQECTDLNACKETLISELRGADMFQDVANDRHIDAYHDEAYEHWIVSSWLADKLEAKGEIIARDIAGLTIWGRCTTGQAISMDSVIEQIYHEMNG